MVGFSFERTRHHGCIDFPWNHRFDMLPCLAWNPQMRQEHSQGFHCNGPLQTNIFHHTPGIAPQQSSCRHRGYFTSLSVSILFSLTKYVWVHYAYVSCPSKAHTRIIGAKSEKARSDKSPPRLLYTRRPTTSTATGHSFEKNERGIRRAVKMMMCRVRTSLINVPLEKKLSSKKLCIFLLTW